MWIWVKSGIFLQTIPEKAWPCSLTFPWHCYHCRGMTGFDLHEDVNEDAKAVNGRAVQILVPHQRIYEAGVIKA